MGVYGNLLKIESNTKSAAGSSFITISAVAGQIHQVIGFSGGSNDQIFSTFLDIGGTSMHTIHGLADTSESIYFGELGPVSGVGEDVTVHTAPTANGNATANLQYRIIK